jgi:hypothetical protein
VTPSLTATRDALAKRRGRISRSSNGIPGLNRRSVKTALATSLPHDANPTPLVTIACEGLVGRRGADGRRGAEGRLCPTRVVRQVGGDEVGPGATSGPEEVVDVVGREDVVGVDERDERAPHHRRARGCARPTPHRALPPGRGPGGRPEPTPRRSAGCRPRTASSTRMTSRAVWVWARMLLRHSSRNSAALWTGTMMLTRLSPEREPSGAELTDHLVQSRPERRRVQRRQVTLGRVARALEQEVPVHAPGLRQPKGSRLPRPVVAEDPDRTSGNRRRVPQRVRGTPPEPFGSARTTRRPRSSRRGDGAGAAWRP